MATARRAIGIATRVFFILACCAVTMNCRAKHRGGADSSEPSQPSDLGGPFTDQYSCKALAFEFDKHAPIYHRILRDFGSKCTEGSFSGPKETDALPTIEIGSGAGKVPVFALPTGKTHQDYTGECWNQMFYLERIRMLLTDVQNFWQRKGCDRTAADGEKLTIVDYPGCRAGCVDGNTSCHTCRIRGDELRGAAVFDTTGEVTCQAKEDAVQAVLDWCAFVGRKDECGDANMECRKAEASKPYAGMSGATLQDRVELATSASVMAYAKVSGEVPGLKADGRAGIKVGSEMKVAVTISGNSASPWVERYGRREGGPNARLECSVTTATFRAIAANGSVEVGLTFIGNGVSGGVEIQADGRTTWSSIGNSFWLPASGLTEDQMKGRCLAWTMHYLKTQIENTGVVRAVETFADAIQGKRYDLSALGPSLTYGGSSTVYEPETLWITIGEKSTSVQYDLKYNYWFNPNSPVYQIPNGDIAPFKDAIVAKSMTTEQLVKFFGEVVKPYSSGRWSISSVE